MTWTERGRFLDRPARFPGGRAGARRRRPAPGRRTPWRAAARSAPCVIRPRWGGRGCRRTPRRMTPRSRPSSSDWPATAAAHSTCSPAGPPTSPAPTLPAASRGPGAREPGEVGPAGPRCVRRQVRREGADGAEAEGVQPGRIPGAGAAIATAGAALVLLIAGGAAALALPGVERPAAPAPGARRVPRSWTDSGAPSTRSRTDGLEGLAAVLVGLAASGWCSSRSFGPARARPAGYEPLDPEETPQGRGAGGAQGDRVRPGDRQAVATRTTNLSRPSTPEWRSTRCGWNRPRRSRGASGGRSGGRTGVAMSRP